MNKIATVTLGAGLLASSAFGKVNFELFIEAITQQDGTTAISDSGLVVLVVDTGEDGFQLPSDGSFVSGNDEVVANWDLANYSFESSDITLLANGVNWGSNWSEGDELALFWFPTLAGSDVPGSDTPYGVFTDGSGLASGNGWFLPSDESFHTLTLITEAATKLAMIADLPSAVGVAAFAVNNAPSTAAPAAPSVDVSNSGGKSTLTWSTSGAPSGGFIVQRRKNGDAWETIGFAESGDTSFEDTDVDPGREYEYRLYSIGTFASTLSNLPGAIISERSVFGNVSARSRVVAGNPATQMFGGVIVEGNDPTKNIIMQAIGRSFFGTDNFVADPGMTIYQGATQVAANDDWLSSANALEIDGAMAAGNAVELSDDAAVAKSSTELLQVEKDKGYAFAVNSNGGDSGDVLLGIFNADSNDLGINDNRIVNLSARGFLGDDAGSLFAGGMIIKGTVPKEVLVMAWGPYLSGTVDPSLEGLTIADPELLLYKGTEVVASNDDWETQTGVSIDGITIETDVDRIRSVIQGLGYTALDASSADAVLLMTVNPGAYTFEIRGNGGTGIGLIAIDEVEID